LAGKPSGFARSALDFARKAPAVKVRAFCFARKVQGFARKAFLLARKAMCFVLPSPEACAQSAGLCARSKKPCD